MGDATTFYPRAYRLKRLWNTRCASDSAIAMAACGFATDATSTPCGGDTDYWVTSDQIEVARGYPVIEARVEYPAEGYAAILSWVQVVRYWVGGHEQPTVIVDVAPQMRDSGVPYFSWGIQPTLFDAPAFGGESNVVWRAWSFLTYTPDALMTPIVEPACGFRWGYDIRDDVIEPTDVLSVGLAEWLDIRNELRERYPRWSFKGDDWAP